MPRGFREGELRIVGPIYADRHCRVEAAAAPGRSPFWYMVFLEPTYFTERFSNPSREPAPVQADMWKKTTQV